ncbi:MAG TPA: glycosyltransferase, partial [Ignavibacteria bacterium]|nr:glycosyltransferase [Ignavibacteria bacterium]
MNKKIAIVTTGHPPYDDRIYWKFAKSLSQNNEVAIFCSTQEINLTSSNITIKGFNSNLVNRREKFNRLTEYLKEFKPDIIICSETSAIIPSLRFKREVNNNCKIISDITEWYPENIASKLKGINRLISYKYLFLSNIVLSNRTDALIIGEKGKKKRYDLIAPFKRKVIVGYYPVLEFFNYTEPSKSETDFTLGYAGVINFKRGILSLLKVFTTLQKKHPGKNIKLKIAGRFEFPDEEEIFNEKLIKNNIQNVEIVGWTDYDKISDNLSDMDVCFDLRELSFIYKNSLPIKLFEYLAAGKPVIYSSIKPLKENITIDDFGFLVNPKNIDEIVNKTERYLLQKELLNKHSMAARKFIEDGNNW